MRKIVVFLITLGLFASTQGSLGAQKKTQSANLDSLDIFVREQMARRHIPGLSLAIIQDGRIVAARAYGVVDETSRVPVTTGTLFQAGSISKPVSALGALHLVEAGRVALDSDVNAKLTTWKVPNNVFLTREKVTLRRILSHSAGLTVHGFPGYDIDSTVPTLLQVLDGGAPANTPPISVDTIPGSIWRYSGGGFTVMQQMIIDVTGKPFPQFMKESVLGPIGMASSSFEQPQPPARTALAAGGLSLDRKPVHGRWHIYPEMAAAGLWTTPTDLARFAIEIQQTLAGGGHGVISPDMAHQFLTVQKGVSGLGIFVQGSGDTLNFTHGGRDEGFDAQLVAFARTGQGAAIMINANDDSRAVGRILNFIGSAYGWPELWDPSGAPAALEGVHLDTIWLGHCAGYYELLENQMITLAPNRTCNGLETFVNGLPDETFLAIDSVRFGSTDRGVRITIKLNPQGDAYGLIWRVGEVPGERSIPRVSPLPSTRMPAPDPDPMRTGRITTALMAIRQGGPALRDAANIALETKKDFANRVGRELDGLGALTWLGDEPVADRGIHRHGSGIDHVVFYKVMTNDGPRYLLVELTAEGSIADFDLVDM